MFLCISLCHDWLATPGALLSLSLRLLILCPHLLPPQPGGRDRTPVRDEHNGRFFDQFADTLIQWECDACATAMPSGALCFRKMGSNVVICSACYNECRDPSVYERLFVGAVPIARGSEVVLPSSLAALDVQSLNPTPLPGLQSATAHAAQAAPDPDVPEQWEERADAEAQQLLDASAEALAAAPPQEPLESLADVGFGERMEMDTSPDGDPPPDAAPQAAAALDSAPPLDAPAPSAANGPPPHHPSSFKDDPAMLVLTAPLGAALELYQIVGAYHQAAISNPDYPPLPTDGVGGRGPSYFIYAMCYDLARQFAQTFPEIEVPERPDLKLRVVARRVFGTTPDSAFASGPVYRTPTVLPSNFIEEECAWMEFALKQGEEFTLVEKADIIKALRSLGIETFRASRLQVKMPEDDNALSDRSKWIPLGPELRTAVINIVVKPLNHSVDDFAWPYFVPIAKERKIGDETLSYNFKLNYRLGGKKLTGIHGQLLQCKRMPDKCECPPSIGDSSGQRRREPAGKAAAAVRSDNYKRGRSIFEQKFGLKNQTPCIHFPKGRCHKGPKCNFVHAGMPEDWARVTCTLSRGAKGGCSAFPWCVYSPCCLHGVERDRGGYDLEAAQRAALEQARRGPQSYLMPPPAARPRASIGSTSTDPGAGKGKGKGKATSSRSPQ